MPKIYRIRLTDDERTQLLSRQRKGSHKSAWHRAASILLLADENAPQGALTDTAIARAVQATVRTVERTRERALTEGLESVLARKPSANPRQPLLDGKAEARLIALCCGEPPEGRACWTLQLLADKLVELEIVPAISDESVRRTLKKRASALAETPVVPPAAGERCICQRDGGRDRSLSSRAGPAAPARLPGRTGAKRR